MVSLSLSVVGAISPSRRCRSSATGRALEGRTAGSAIAQSKYTFRATGGWWSSHAFLVVTIVAINFVGDGLRDVPDPKSESSWRDRRSLKNQYWATCELRVTFLTESGESKPSVVDVTVGPGEMLGVVARAPASVTFLAAMGLLPKSAKIEGSVKVHGQELVGMSNNDMRKQRGKRISMIFQDPLSALNPTHRIGHQISEMVRSHTDMTKTQAWDRAIELLDEVGIPQPRTRVSQYPHEFSGGMRQRVMIAIAIANDPDVLIADEPTTALDVTVQAQILDVIQNIQHNFRASVVFITHDLGVVARIADRVQVMYAGRTVERGDVESIFRNPTHPYTRGRSPLGARRERLTPIPGAPPNMLRPPGCAPGRGACMRKTSAQGDPELHSLLGLETACVRRRTTVLQRRMNALADQLAPIVRRPRRFSTLPTRQRVSLSLRPESSRPRSGGLQRQLRSMAHDSQPRRRERPGSRPLLAAC